MVRWIGMLVLLVGVLAGCGGSGDTGASAQTRPGSADRGTLVDPAGTDLMRGQSRQLDPVSYGMPLDGVDKALMQQQLSAYFNGRKSGEPSALMGRRSSYAGLGTTGLATKAAVSSPQSVYRLFNTATGVHFYTMSLVEKNQIVATMPQFRFEGPAFFAMNATDAPLSPVYRFYSIYTGTHFYTIDPDERDYVQENLSAYFVLEGVAWYATTFEGPGWVPMHRFFNNVSSTHFYTTSEEERLRVQATLPYMEYEGIGYYVRSDGLPLKQSPVAATIENNRPCVLAQSPEDLVFCGTPGALPLASQVEGRREAFNPYTPRYEAVPGQSLSDCASDRYTGLTWESKPFSGPRDLARRFTHLDRTDQPQVVVKTAGGVSGALIDVPRTPTQAELDASTNSTGYVNYINGLALCGFTDWRIPTSSELVNVMNLLSGRFGAQDTDGRFITSDGATWSIDQTLAGGSVSRSTVDGMVTLGREALAPDARQTPMGHGYRATEVDGQFSVPEMYRLMLVRGAARPGATRFSSLSIAYGTDAAGNVVLDNWSGLQWRRCLEGQRWTGASCSGTPVKLHLGVALSWAAGKPGWRLAGAKELESLRQHRSDLSQIQTYTDQFPLSGLNPLDLPFWSVSMFMEYEYREDPVGSGNYGFVSWLSTFQVNYRATAAGTAPVTLMPHQLPSALGYVRLVRVHP